MGCTVREKHIRANRRSRSVKPDVDRNNLVDKTSPMSNPIEESIAKQLNRQLDAMDASAPINYRPSNNFDETGWGYCTEEQLEDILMKNLDFLYHEAISKLVSLGYDRDRALTAILRNGHCYGGMDVLTNILHYSLAYLNNGENNGYFKETPPFFSDLRQLEIYSLGTMVCLLRQVKPNWSKGDAMWCLLMSDLHVGKACMMEGPAVPSPMNNVSGDTVPNNAESLGNNSVGVVPALCRFHGGWGYGNGGTSEFPVNGFFPYGSEMNLQREIELPKRFNLTPAMKSLLKRNVAAFAAGFRSNTKQMQGQWKASPSAFPSRDSLCRDVPGPEELLKSKNQDVVNSMLSKFSEMNLDENMNLPEDEKDEAVISLIHQIKDLEQQVKERKEWAHQKAVQAARKLSTDLTELNILRMEREETQRMKKGKQPLEDTTMKRLSEMENALRKASGQVDRANAAVRRLEIENAEIRAEMEASKLSASESVTTCLEVAKREKKCLKRLLAWEKQKTKIQGEIAAEKQKISECQKQLVQIEEEQKEAEVKRRQEQKAKELALAQVEEERRLKEATEVSTKRKLEALRLKIEIDFQRHKDDLKRLEHDLSRLKVAAAQSTEVVHLQLDDIPTGGVNSVGAKSRAGSYGMLIPELDKLEEDSSVKAADNNRACLICKRNEVSVVFLPCTHQVLCAYCNENYAKKGKATCPCCRIPIEQRICVFGASS